MFQSPNGARVFLTANTNKNNVGMSVQFQSPNGARVFLTAQKRNMAFAKVMFQSPNGARVFLTVVFL